MLFLDNDQPKIIGDRVVIRGGDHFCADGHHAGGRVIGGLLAIPVAMALRAVLFRYVWVKRKCPRKPCRWML